MPDVSYHLNSLMKNEEYVVINCAIEESTLGERKENKLLEQDKFIQNRIKKEDILIVSVGGNDIALSPNISTIWNMLLLMKLNSENTIINSKNIFYYFPFI